MRLSASDGLRGDWHDLATGQPIRWVRWADPDTGDYEAWRYDEATCQRLYAQGSPVSRLIVRGHTRLRFVPRDPEPQPIALDRPRPDPVQQIAAICAIAPDFVRDWKPIEPVPGIECDYPGCHKLAVYETGDDHEIEPEQTRERRLCLRAVTTAVHRSCEDSRHFRPPVHTNLRGVESEKHVRIRPQW